MAMSLRTIGKLSLVLLVGQTFCYGELFFHRDEEFEEFRIPSDTMVNLDSESLADDERDMDTFDIAEIGARFVAMLRVNNGGRWGRWGPAKFCKNGSFAVGYDMKIEPRQRIDNTALNAIKLICEDRYGNVTDEVTSIEGPWGSWVGQTKCRGHAHLSSFDLQVEKYMGKGRDDTAANYVKFKCRCRHRRTYELVKPPGHGLWGTWGPWSDNCPNRTAICGIQTKVESRQGKFRDDTALNDVRFFCCNF